MSRGKTTALPNIEMPIRHASSASEDDETTPSTTTAPHKLDLEKQVTARDHVPHQVLAPQTSSRITRTQSLIHRNTNHNRFTHPLSHVKTSPDAIVDFDGPDDPYRPINWPFRKKLITTLLYGLTTMGSTWASSVYSPAVNQISEQYGVAEEVGILGVSFLLMGFGLGPLLWAPLSEVYIL